ncbi:tetratricopeptide repeat protein [Haliea sp. E17]|uniref:tetratricopeptide repeat protein n=1 Tax=Haliea sp. E17 TaxID=3401576 RepID=UPI003AB0ED7D
MHYKNLLSALLLSLFTASLAAAGDFVGSETCTGCHAEQHTLWTGSDHDLAMQEATAETVLGDFDDATFSYNGITSRFFRSGDKFMVRTDGEDGKLQDFEVAYVFGHYPLQQYLLPLSRGRLQALSIAWDSRPAAEGGQRWYHLYPDETIDASDPLHWTGPYQNWNTRCAECHSTDLQKNYDLASRSFTTRYEEIDVACEACHGPGRKHLALAAQDALAGVADGGFAVHLKQRGEWHFPEDGAIAQRTAPLESRAQVDACGRCHSRRGTLGDYHYGADLLDTHRLALPVPPLYYVDGQVLDEDYVYGSFAQSKMHQAGVVCSNCHEPHSGQLRAPGNAVCAQCHKPAVYDTPEHHFHAAGSTGAECANCHMPETTYMGVDPRRDHSLRVPRPDLSLVLGVPNACNQCHLDRDPDWALAALRDKGVVFRDTARHPARAFAQLAAGDGRALPVLASIAMDSSAAPIWRASAMEALGEVGGREAMQSMSQLLYSDDSIIRASTVRSIQFLNLQQQLQLLTPLLEDPVLTVRMDIASNLAAVPLEQLPAEQGQKLRKLFTEYESVLKKDADMPSNLMQLGVFYASRGQAKEAENMYRAALELNPQMIGAYLNLADLERARGQDDAARLLLLDALAITPDNGSVLHSLGLLETRAGDRAAALDYLGRAAALETTGMRHRFVYAIALHDLGEPRKAIAELEKLLKQFPGNAQLIQVLAAYSEEIGDSERARRYQQMSGVR